MRKAATVVSACAAAMAFALGGAVVVPARAEAGYAGPCSDGAGVSVVVDARELSTAAPSTRCAPQAGGHGLEILTKAGVSYQTASRSPGFVCKIAGLPTDEPCQETSPASAYWSYWLARRGGTWCLSNRGAQNRTPPAGTVEGWSFAKGRQDTGPLPPRADPPPPVPGVEPAPLASGDCDSVSRTGTTAPTSAPPASAPPSTASQPRPTSAAEPPASTASLAPAPDGRTGRDREGASGAPGSVPPSGDPPGVAPQAVDAAAPSGPSAAGPPVTIAVTGSKERGSPGPAAAATALAAGLLATAFVVASRRRRARAASGEEPR